MWNFLQDIRARTLLSGAGTASRVKNIHCVGFRYWVVAALGFLILSSLLPQPLARVSDSVGHVEMEAAALGARFMEGWARGALATLDAPSAIAAAPAPGTWTPLARGMEYRTVKVGAGIVLYQARLDLSRGSLKVLYAPDLGSKRAAVATMARQAKALAAVNASYFDDRGRALGYLKFQGRVVVPSVATGSAFTGVFVLQDGKPRILARAAFRPARCEMALQAGPRLVAGGRPTTGLRETRSFRQSGIAVTRGGRVVLYATGGSYRGMTWDKLRRVLLGPEVDGGIQPSDVLNLDGGSSSQIFIDPPAAPDVSDGFPTPVPVGLGFISPHRVEGR
jgi:uncharacterized protein YigE (DUF2233 family)